MGKEKNVMITMDDVHFNYNNVTISIKDCDVCLVIDTDIIKEAVKEVLTSYGKWEQRGGRSKDPLDWPNFFKGRDC